MTARASNRVTVTVRATLAPSTLLLARGRAKYQPTTL
nr:MAG TPA_asm: hypothetical protein [Caudoviricetes sp.]